MATNQVIHGSNRVVENPNRYKLNAVSGQANTYDLEKVPGVITDNGTPYSKAVLDKIDNVLSYLTPSVEKKTIVEEIPFTKSRLLCSTINQTFGFDSYVNYIDGKMEQYGQRVENIPTYNISTTARDGFKIRNDGNTYYSGLCAFTNTNLYTPNDVLNRLKSTTKGGDYQNCFRIFVNNNKAYIDYDFKNQINFTYKCNIYIGEPDRTTIKLYTSNDNVQWEYIQDVISNSSTTINITNARYFRVEIDNVNTRYSYSEVYIYYSYFSNLNGNEIITSYYNDFTLDNNGNTFENNQRLLIETPLNTDIIDIESNILNGIDIQTILRPNSKYELIYKESSNKFVIGNLSDNQPLFDVVLNQEVNQVELSGLSSKLEVGKLYNLQIQGYAKTNYTLYFGESSFGYLTTAKPYNCVFMVMEENNEKYVSSLGLSNTSTASSFKSKITNNEVLKFGALDPSYAFTIGTRIIVKEVA